MTGVALGRVPPWGVATVVSAAGLALALALLSLYAPVSTAFVVAASAVFAFETGVFCHANRVARREAGRQPFTPATLVTAVRGAAVVVLAGFVAVGPTDGALAWLPALLFGAAALFDGVDGVLARATDAVSEFGARLDGEIDALVVLVGVLVAVRFGSAPLVFVLVGLARYLFVAGIALRRVRGKPVRELPPRLSRRVLGATGMVVVFLLLVPLLPPAYARPLAVVAMVPFLLGFVRDWLLVTR